MDAYKKELVNLDFYGGIKQDSGVHLPAVVNHRNSSVF